MKVVLLAGGLGTRMREETEYRPKPMVEIGGKPMLWHIMKVFASFGHTDFIICTGYKSEAIEDYFFHFGMRNSDFSLTLGDQSSLEFHVPPEEMGWKVSVVHTGIGTPTGGRIKHVKEFLNGERFFCAYGDTLAPVDLDSLLHQHEQSSSIATMTVTRPVSRFGVVEFGASKKVLSFREKPNSEGFVNIGFFVLEHEIFEFLDWDSALEEDALTSAAAGGNLSAFVHDGFWQPMDTYKEAQRFNELWDQAIPPWKTW